MIRRPRILEIFAVLLAIQWLFCHTNPIFSQAESIIKQPRNIILMIGDGMGLAHISAHIYQERGSVLMQVKDIGLMQTHSADDVVTDSGASATAMATGKKTTNNAVGLDKNHNRAKSIMEIARDAGMSTGMVTTSTILDATPAAFYGHRVNRYYYDSIAVDLLNCNFDFILGGGKKYFDNTMDGRPDLLPLFKKAGYDIFDFRTTPINRLKTHKSDKIFYFNGQARPYLELLGNKFLSTASIKAIEFLENQSEKGFFLLIEEAQIDWAGHAGNAEALLERMNSFENAIRSVLAHAEQNKETLVIITADHATGGLSIQQGSEFGNVKLNFSTNGHTASMVPVFSIGPGSEHFRGVFDNSMLFRKMMQALSIETPKTAHAN